MFLAFLSAPVAAQQNAMVGLPPPTWEPARFYVVPFGGLPHVQGVGGVQEAVGAHVIWPAPRPLALSLRYELRWSRGAQYDAGSVDVLGRIVGTDTAAISMTTGWARWNNEDYGTVGVRLNWPLVKPPPEWFPVMQGWLDFRYAARTPRELYTLEGGTWVEIMLAFVLPMQIRGP